MIKPSDKTHLLIEPDLNSGMGLEQLEDEVDRREQDSAPTTASTSSHNGAVELVLAEVFLSNGMQVEESVIATVDRCGLALDLFASAMVVQLRADVWKLKCSYGAL